MFLAGLIAAIAIIFLLFKFNLKRIAKYDIVLDIAITFFLIWIFAGTFAGMMAGRSQAHSSPYFFTLPNVPYPAKNFAGSRQSRSRTASSLGYKS